MTDEFDLSEAIFTARKKAKKSDAERLENLIRRPLTPMTSLEIKREHGRRMTESISNTPTYADFPRLAEGYYLQGDFEIAISFAEGERLIEYQKVLDSLYNPKCECPEITGHGTQAVKAQYKKEEFLRNNSVVSLWKCVLCGNYQMRED